MRNGVIRIWTEEPDYSWLGQRKYDWKYTCYGGTKEEDVHDAPAPLGKCIITSSFTDAGRSVTGILHFFDKTPIDWFT